EDMEVGGRNLLPDTSDEWDELHRPEGNWFYEKGSNYQLKVGETYTFSLIVEKVSDDDVPINLHLGAGRTPGTYSKDISSWRMNKIPFGKRISLTHTIAESDLNGSSGEHTYFSFRLRNERKETTIRFKEVKLEKGTVATDWSPAPEDMATQAQLSVLNDNINMRVSKGELMSQINIEAGRTLIQSNKLYLDAQSVVFSGQAFIPGAVIKNASIDGAKIANATIGSAKIAN